MFYSVPELIFEILQFIDWRAWKQCFPFVINRNFHQVLSSEAFAQVYYSNLKTLSSSQVNSLKEMIINHSVHFGCPQHDDDPPRKKIKNSKQQANSFWILLKEFILNKPDLGLSGEKYPTTRFGWVNSLKMDDCKIRTLFVKLLEKDFKVVKDLNMNHAGELLISSENVKKLLEFEKMDIQVQNFDLNKSCYHNSSSCTLSMDHTIYVDWGYPLHVHTKFMHLSVRSGNYCEVSLSISVNGKHLFEWNYNDTCFPIVYLNEEFLNDLLESVFKFKEKQALLCELSQNTPQETEVLKVFQTLVLKFIDPSTYLESHLNIDLEFMSEELSRRTNLFYCSEWTRTKQ